MHSDSEESVSRKETPLKTLPTEHRTPQTRRFIKRATSQRISAATVRDVILGKYSPKRYLIVDCRFPYEFTGGHVVGALNYPPSNDSGLLEKIFGHSGLIDTLSVTPDNRLIVIVHCEFSQVRGPAMASVLLNHGRCDLLEVYVMKGGYADFYRHYPELCDPRGYINMHEQIDGDRVVSMINRRNACLVRTPDSECALPPMKLRRLNDGSDVSSYRVFHPRESLESSVGYLRREDLRTSRLSDLGLNPTSRLRPSEALDHAFGSLKLNDLEIDPRLSLLNESSFKQVSTPISSDHSSRVQPIDDHHLSLLDSIEDLHNQGIPTTSAVPRPAQESVDHPKNFLRFHKRESSCEEPPSKRQALIAPRIPERGNSTPATPAVTAASVAGLDVPYFKSWYGNYESGERSGERSGGHGKSMSCDRVSNLPDDSSPVYSLPVVIEEDLISSDDDTDTHDQGCGDYRSVPVYSGIRTCDPTSPVMSPKTIKPCRYDMDPMSPVVVGGGGSLSQCLEATTPQLIAKRLNSRLKLKEEISSGQRSFRKSVCQSIRPIMCFDYEHSILHEDPSSIQFCSIDPYRQSYLLDDDLLGGGRDYRTDLLDEEEEEELMRLRPSSQESLMSLQTLEDDDRSSVRFEDERDDQRLEYCDGQHQGQYGRQDGHYEGQNMRGRRREVSMGGKSGCSEAMFIRKDFNQRRQRVLSPMRQGISSLHAVISSSIDNWDDDVDDVHVAADVSHDDDVQVHAGHHHHVIRATSNGRASVVSKSVQGIFSVDDASRQSQSVLSTVKRDDEKFIVHGHTPHMSGHHHNSHEGMLQHLSTTDTVQSYRPISPPPPPLNPTSASAPLYSRTNMVSQPSSAPSIRSPFSSPFASLIPNLNKENISHVTRHISTHGNIRPHTNIGPLLGKAGELKVPDQQKVTPRSNSPMTTADRLKELREKIKAAAGKSMR